jgi:hypothetical protein
MYAEVLDQPLSTLPHHQALTELETEIWDKRQFDLVLLQHIFDPLRFALQLAYQHCEKLRNKTSRANFSPLLTWAKGNEGSRFRPDYSCVRKEKCEFKYAKTLFQLLSRGNGAFPQTWILVP